MTGGTVVAVDRLTGDMRHVVPVGEDPLLMVRAGDRLWALNSGDGSLSMIDPDKPTEAARIEIDGEPPAAIAADGDKLWAAANGNELVELDARTGAEEGRLTLGPQRLFRLRDAGFLAVAGGSIWLTVPTLGISSEPQALWRIDRATGTVSARIPIAADPLPLFVHEGAVYVAHLPGRLLRVDATSNEVIGTDLHGVPGAVAGTSGSVWVGRDLGRDVVRLDSRTLEEEATIPIGQPVRGLTSSDDRVWATSESSLYEIDAGTNQLLRTIRLLPEQRRNFGPASVVLLGDLIWVSVE